MRRETLPFSLVSPQKAQAKHASAPRGRFGSAPLDGSIMRPPGAPRPAPAGARHPAPAALRAEDFATGATDDGHGEAELQQEPERSVPTGALKEVCAIDVIDVRHYIHLSKVYKVI